VRNLGEGRNGKGEKRRVRRVDERGIDKIRRRRRDRRREDMERVK
jgi:hypothetical protein